MWVQTLYSCFAHTPVLCQLGECLSLALNYLPYLLLKSCSMLHNQFLFLIIIFIGLHVFIYFFILVLSLQFSVDCLKIRNHLPFFSYCQISMSGFIKFHLDYFEQFYVTIWILSYSQLTSIFSSQIL